MATRGDYIRDLRTSRGMTQSDMAKAVGVSRVAVTKWESGNTGNLKLDNLLALCRLFGLTTDELISATRPGHRIYPIAPQPSGNHRAHETASSSYDAPSKAAINHATALHAGISAIAKALNVKPEDLTSDTHEAIKRIARALDA